MKKNFSSWTQQGATHLYRQLASDREGLTTDQAKKLLERYGPNESQTHIDTIFTLLLHQFVSPFNYLLLIASLIAFAVGEQAEGILITFLALINVMLGLFQEYKAHCAMLLLKRYIPSEARVLRDGKSVIINKSLLVPGDIVILEAGMTVPADLRLVTTSGILIDEAVLTGESIPVEKIADALKNPATELFEAHNIAFAATTVMSGSAHGIVFATGNETMFHNITIGGPEAIRVSTYEHGIIRLSKAILTIVILSVAVILGIKIILHGPLNIADFFIFSLTLIVAIVPEALPTVTMFSLSQAALKLVRNHVVVKRLSAIEDLGDIEILCTDKTGTLTETQLSLDQVVTSDKAKLLLYACVGTDTQGGQKGPSAFEELIKQSAPHETLLESEKLPVVKGIPFDATRMHSSFIVEDKHGKRFLIIKGAPEKLLAMSSSVEGTMTRQEMGQLLHASGISGKRTFGIAYKPWQPDNSLEKEENDFIFLGFFSFINPLKKGAEKTIKLAQKMGVRVKMITGDNSEVAGFVAKQVGLIEHESDVIEGKKLADLEDNAFAQACIDYVVFARIDPVTKARIITSLQKSHEVGFLGEGINDVPALKQSNIALVVKDATDIARSYADIILLKADMPVIIEGIRQGRIIFSNINKYIRCTLASNFGNYYSLAFISLILPFLPLLPSQILLVNLLSDLPLISIASDTVDIDELRRPKSYSLKRTLVMVIILGLTASSTDFIFLGYYYQLPPANFRTLWFIFNVLSEIAFIFSIRTLRPFFKATFPSKPLLITSLVGIASCIVLPYTNFGQHYFQFTQPKIMDLLLIFTLVCIYFVTSEIIKLICVHFLRKMSKED